MIPQGKTRKAFMRKEHLRGPLNEFWRDANNDLG